MALDSSDQVQSHIGTCLGQAIRCQGRALDEALCYAWALVAEARLVAAGGSAVVRSSSPGLVVVGKA